MPAGPQSPPQPRPHVPRPDQPDDRHPRNLSPAAHVLTIAEPTAPMQPLTADRLSTASVPPPPAGAVSVSDLVDLLRGPHANSTRSAGASSAAPDIGGMSCPGDRGDSDSGTACPQGEIES